MSPKGTGYGKKSASKTKPVRKASQPKGKATKPMKRKTY